jgi:hypothetical protein
MPRRAQKAGSARVAMNDRKSGSQLPSGNLLPLVTPKEAREMIRQRTGYFVPESTFYCWLRREEIYFIRMGKKFLIPRFVMEEVCKQSLRGRKFDMLG